MFLDGERGLTLRDEVVGELPVADPVNRIDAEDLTSDQSAFEFLDELVVPRHRTGRADLLLVAWFGGVHVARFDHDEYGLECVRYDTSLHNLLELMFWIGWRKLACLWWSDHI